MFLGIPRETGNSKGLTSFISFPLHPSVSHFPPRLSRDGSLSQDHTAGSGLTPTRLPCPSLHSKLFKQQPRVQKQLPALPLLGEDAGGSGTVQTERDSAKTDH